MKKSDEEAIRDWLVEKGYIKPEDRDTADIRICRTAHDEEE